MQAEQRLQKKAEALAVKEAALGKKVVESLAIDTSGPFRGTMVDRKTGEVTAIYCPCVSCQAQLNNTTVSVATEHMIKSAALPPAQAEELRKWAKDVDAGLDKPMVH